uniref:Endonuclease/exonuclease/phosphatase domain-containing protein n=1 Tax=viral metagenome TaxID=1070528 RepID=A0A6C0ITU8_9ZZZZ
MNLLVCSLLILSFFLTDIMCLTDTECPNVSSFGDRRKSKNTLRLVQYNVEWLFIDYYSAMDCPGNGCTWKTLSDAEIHMNYVADTIRALNPDILNLCEVEGCDELNILKNLLNTTNTINPYNTYLKKGTDTGTGQNVGLITKIDPITNLYRSNEKIEYPIAGSTCGYTGTSSTTSVSKHYITEFQLATSDKNENKNINVALISAHLIAIPTDSHRCAQREAQTQILQNIIYSYIQKGYEIIVIGDMNDYDNEVLDLNGDIPLSSVLRIIKGLKGSKQGLYTLTNVAYRVPQNERFSDWYDSDNNCNTTSTRDYSMIDHILVTNNIDKKIANAFIYHGYKEYCGKWNSDHYPVVVDFVF